MKKFWFLLSLFFLSTVLFAQDIIITTDGKKIEALVTKITETTVSYRKWNNANGPTYKMNVENIRKIRYENEKIETVTNTQQQIEPSTVSEIESTEQPQQAEEILLPPIKKSQQPPILMIGDDLHNIHGRELEKYEIQEYFGSMYELWSKYTTQYMVGSVLLGIGTGICVGSFVAGALLSPYSDPAITLGIATVGLVFDAVGIPLCIVGKKKRNALYLERISQDYQAHAELMFGGTKYGTWVSLRF